MPPLDCLAHNVPSPLEPPSATSRTVDGPHGRYDFSVIHYITRCHEEKYKKLNSETVIDINSKL